MRETAIFSEIPVAERALAERACGVWAIDITTGRVVAFLRFDDAVQEVFAVAVLPGVRYPELIQEDPDKLLADSYDLPCGGKLKRRYSEAALPARSPARPPVNATTNSTST